MQNKSDPITRVYLNAPAEYLSIWSPVIRLFFIVAMLYKGRAPHATRLNLIVDESAQLKRFEALKRAFTYGRGMGVRAWALYQDIGSIEEHFGREGVQTFFGSAQCRQLFGIRDFQTAKLVSDMLGTQTLEYDNTLAQNRARQARLNIVRDVMNGADPMDQMLAYAQQKRESTHRTKQARLLYSPDEVLALPENKQFLFISGKNLKPAVVDKYPYYTRRELAGRYLSNPYHPPADRVRIQGLIGKRMVQVITGPVPRKYRDFPQYAGGKAKWLKGRPIR